MTTRNPKVSAVPAPSRTCLAGVIVSYGDVDSVQIAPVDRPVAGPGQVLVRVEAVGVNPFDYKLRTGRVADAFPLELPQVFGLELAGVVAETGADVTALRAGDRVMGDLRGPGAFSQFVAVDQDKLCVTPPSLSSLHAASIPSAALTAWGAIRQVSDLTGTRVLVHGASGAVGSFAVQFAAAAGAKIYGTSSRANVDYVMSLGASQVFAREDASPHALTDIDLIIDCVGGQSVDDLWTLMNPEGTLISVADPHIATRAPQGIDARWYVMAFEPADLKTIASDVAQGRLRSTIADVMTFHDLAFAVELCGTKHHPGKVVVAVP